VVHHVAVIDLGKTNSKVALVDTKTASEIHVVKQAAAVNNESLYPSLDHNAIEDFVFDSLYQFSKIQTIDAITVTTHGATAALLDKHGDLALPVLDYEFKGVDDTREAYNQYRPPFEQTGSPALPGGLNIGAQLFWQYSNYPKEFANAHTILTWPQYWVHLLSGERHNDVTSLGCHTDLFEPQHQRYSTLLASLDWHNLMPPTRHSGQPCGHLTADAANRLKMPRTTPVYTGIHDSNASLVPHLVSQTTPFTVVSTGTWFIVMSVGGKAPVMDESRDTLLNVNAHGESVPSARFMGGRERDSVGISQTNSEEAIDELLSQTEDPAMLLPSVVSGTGPFPNAASNWVGQTNDKDKSLRSCAVTFYLALMTYECMKLVNSDGPIFIEGPLAQDQHFAQMLSVVSEQQVNLSLSETGTSVGAAMLISSPETLPSYKPVEAPDHRREKLKRYSQVWQDRLQRHAM
jgi:sugar (pentulose or hexulose) kinase